MVVVQEYHQFTSVSGGYQCLNCSAYITQAQLLANAPTVAQEVASPVLSSDFNAILMLAYKAAGLP